jgi:hypothetical protein
MFQYIALYRCSKYKKYKNETNEAGGGPEHFTGECSVLFKQHGKIDEEKYTERNCTNSDTKQNYF